MKLFDVKLYESYCAPKAEEMETVRGLTEVQKIALVSYLERNKIRYLVKEVKPLDTINQDCPDCKNWAVSESKEPCTSCMADYKYTLRKIHFEPRG